MKLELAFFLLLVASCSGNVSTIEGAGGTTGTGTPTSTGSNGAGGAAPLDCPEVTPQGNMPCSVEGLLCTYGDTPVPSCRTTAICIQGAWQVKFVKCPGPDPMCPSQVPLNDTECKVEGMVCAVADGTICNCSSCIGPCAPPPPWWQCSTPAPGCPTLAPNAGTACDGAPPTCVYGNPCSSGVSASCTQGVWSWDAVACATDG